MKKRNTKRTVQLAAAATLAAVLITGQTVGFSVQADSDSIQISSMIPENVTIDQPVPLYEISLPSSDYGTLSWANDSSVPSEHVQSYEVVFRPYDSSILSKVSGWDGESDAIYGSVTVVVSGISEDSCEESDYEEDYDGGDSEYSEEQEEDYCGEYSEYSEEQEEDYCGGDSGYSEEQERDYNGGDSDSSEEQEEDYAENEQAEEQGESESQEKNGETISSEETVLDREEENGGSEHGEEKQAESLEVTAAPEAADILAETEEQETMDSPGVTEIPEAAETPAVTETPEDTDEPEAGSVPETTDIPEPTAAVPSVTPTPAADKNNIFDGEQKKIETDTRSDSAEENLTEEEQQARAAENHTCAGITVSGANLPWYVQFRVTSGESYQFSNESEANVFKSYEFELWDLKNDTEYEIPDGEYISVTVPVKAGYEYTIEHLLDSGATETIVPSVEGSTMVFSTHSFSPFGIAGSKSLTDNTIEDKVYVTATPTPAAQTTEAASSSASDTAVTQEADTQSVSADTAEEESYSGSTEESSQEDTGNSVNAVHTGDDTPILPFVILGVAAVVIICVIVYLRKRK